MTIKARLPVPISPGEFLDRITSLAAEKKRPVGRSRRAEISAELKSLEKLREDRIGFADELISLESELFAIHAALLANDDALERLEDSEEFGPKFVEAARAAHRHQARRRQLIAEIDDQVDQDWSQPRLRAA